MRVCCCYWGRSLGVGRDGGVGSQRPGGSRQAGGVCVPLSSQKGRKKAVHLVSRAFGSFFLRRPFFWAEVSLQRRGWLSSQRGSWRMSRADPVQPPTGSPEERTPVLVGPDSKGPDQPAAPTGLTAEGLCRPPPETGRGALLSQQQVLPPLQGLLGLVAQLQIGLRDCGSTSVTRPHPYSAPLCPSACVQGPPP